MPKKVPLCRIGVSREGKTVFPPVGVAFDFTKDEIADLERMAKETKQEYVRDPKNEAPEEGAVKKTGDKKTGNTDL